MLTIGRLARLAGTTADTIRYYERRGLLPRPQRTAAGYRQFPDGAAHRLAVIRNAQRFGFSLAEIAGFLRVRDAGGQPCRAVRAAGQRMLEAVDRQIADLKASRREMDRTLKAWDRALATTPAGEQARLLERVSARVGAYRHSRSLR